MTHTIPRIIVTNKLREEHHTTPTACSTPEQAYLFWQTHIATQPDHEPDKENVVVVLLNSRLEAFSWNRVSIGDVSSATAHPREVLRPVITVAAAGFILLHNHPSGDPSPSSADTIATNRLNQCADIFMLRFLDHIIIGTPAPGRAPYLSFREAGVIS